MAARPTGSQKRWNLFARELEDILKTRGVTLGQLARKTSINPAKVSRLQFSLSQERPKQLTLLPKEEIDEIIEVFDLTCEEQLRLRASVLATGVERVLMNFLDAQNALVAAEQLTPAILETLRHCAHGQTGLALFARGSDEAEPAP